MRLGPTDQMKLFSAAVRQVRLSYDVRRQIVPDLRSSCTESYVNNYSATYVIIPLVWRHINKVQLCRARLVQGLVTKKSKKVKQ